jgi:hypothetical protein
MHAYRLAASCLTGCALLAACAGPGTGTPTRAAVASVAPASAAPASVAPASAAPASVDWKAVAYPAAGCMSRSEWLALGVGAQDWDAAQVHVQTAELTGDGTPEVVVQLACPWPTGGSPDVVVVFTPDGSKLLGRLGENLWFQGATVTTDGGRVTIAGPTVAGEDPLCCPAHHGQMTYRWNGARFVADEVVQTPS